MRHALSLTLGWLLVALSAVLTVPLVTAALFAQPPAFGGEAMAFFYTQIAALATGCALLLARRGKKPTGATLKDGFLIAASSWIVIGAFSALPYIFSGAIPNVMDAFFESFSGLTTTGASALTDISSVPKGALLWRSMTQWLGGIGIVVLFVAILPMVSEGGHNLFRAEIPGGANFQKVTPRIRQTARILWKVYLALTVAEMAALSIAGVPLYDAACHAFSTMSTGGFSTYPGSVEDMNGSAARWIIILFMFLAGTNFTLHYRVLKNGTSAYVNNAEFVLYFAIFLCAGVAVSFDLLFTGHGGGAFWTCLTDGFFQTTSILTTTGFSSSDFGAWSNFSQAVLLGLMFIGGCAGSTAGSMKVVRALLTGKAIAAEMRIISNPQEVVVTRMNGKVLSEGDIRNPLVFLALFVGVFMAGGLFLSLMGLDLVSAFSASIACLGNIGPGLGAVGPSLNYAAIPAAGKAVLMIEMIMGRLELFGVLIFLTAMLKRGD